MTDNITKAPNSTVTMAVKLTRKASEPYLASPEFSRNVSFSRKPRAAVPTAKMQISVPNTTCHGTDSLLRALDPPGQKKVKNPYSHCQVQKCHFSFWTSYIYRGLLHFEMPIRLHIRNIPWKSSVFLFFKYCEKYEVVLRILYYYEYQLLY